MIEITSSAKRVLTEDQKERILKNRQEALNKQEKLRAQGVLNQKDGELKTIKEKKELNPIKESEPALKVKKLLQEVEITSKKRTNAFGNGDNARLQKQAKNVILQSSFNVRNVAEMGTFVLIKQWISNSSDKDQFYVFTLQDNGKDLLICSKIHIDVNEKTASIRNFFSNISSDLLQTTFETFLVMIKNYLNHLCE